MHKYVLILICCFSVLIGGLQAAFNNNSADLESAYFLNAKNADSGSLSALSILNGDDCASTTVLTEGTTFMTGTNIGATVDEEFDGDTGCDAEVYEASVWFEFTPTTTGSLVVTIENNGGTDPTGDMSIVVTDDTDCDVALGWFCGDYDTEIEAQDVQAYCSVVAGVTYFIQVSTETVNAGDFNITMESMANDANDLCGGADVLPTLTCSNQVTGSEMIDLACPDAEAGCVSALEPGVWFELPIDAAVPYFDISGNDFEIFEGPDCSSLTSLGCDDVEEIEVDPALNYYILAIAGATWTAEPTFAEQTGSGDECDDAISVGQGTTAAFTICQTADHNVCGGSTTDTDAQTIWFSYTMTGNAGLSIIVNDAGTYPLTDFSLVVFDACGGSILDDNDGDPTDTEDCAGTFGEDHEIGCLEAGTEVLIAVGSSQDGAGEFEIEITEVDLSPANDECGDAEALSDGSAMEGTLVCADQEFTTGCGNDENQIYYTYTTGADKADLTITVEGSTATTGTAATDVSVILLEDCGGTLFNDPAAESCNVLGSDIELICLEPNTEITILITANFADAGDISITVDEVATAASQPNDDCADAEAIAVDGSATGNTDCANPDHDQCGGSDTDPDYQTVWYQYTVGTDGTDLEIVLSGSGGNPISLGNASIAVFEDCAGDLADEYDQINGSATVCGGDQINLSCVPAGDYFIAVGSDLVGEGEFEISVDETIVDVENDECADATVFSSGACPTCDNTCANGTEAFCGLDGSTSHDVWFVYEIQENPTTVTITADAVSADDVSVQAYDACGGMILGEACGSGTELLLECVTTDVWFVVSSADGEEGTFNLSIEENAPPSKITVVPTVVVKG